MLASSVISRRTFHAAAIGAFAAGHRELSGIKPGNIELMTEKYRASGGIEHFISFEDSERDILIGFLRLRFPMAPHGEELVGAALVRELHVYGSMGRRVRMRVNRSGSTKGMGRSFLAMRKKGLGMRGMRRSR